MINFNVGAEKTSEPYVHPISNYIITFIFHSILYYYFIFNILFQQIVLFILVSHEDF
jgi:hypothetical protein